MGNPPFVGFVWRRDAQQEQFTRLVSAYGANSSRLDYVAAWFIKAGQYLNGILPLRGGDPRSGGGARASTPALASQPPPDESLGVPARATPPSVGWSPSLEGEEGNHRIRIAFVATNSIIQGEQVAQLWPLLFDRFGLEIAFAHRTFSWGSEARGKAHVHVVIVGSLTATTNPPRSGYSPIPISRAHRSKAATPH